MMALDTWEEIRTAACAETTPIKEEGRQLAEVLGTLQTALPFVSQPLSGL